MVSSNFGHGIVINCKADSILFVLNLHLDVVIEGSSVLQVSLTSITLKNLHLGGVDSSEIRQSQTEKNFLNFQFFKLDSLVL